MTGKERRDGRGGREGRVRKEGKKGKEKGQGECRPPPRSLLKVGTYGIQCNRASV